MSHQNFELPILFHLRWISKVALSVTVLAGIGLVLTLALITGGDGPEYRAAIRASGLTRQNLGPAILVFGLAMAVVAGLVTWLISLYGSFCVAGPLFRFSENLKNAIEHPAAMPTPIRRTDMLQAEWKEFEASLAALSEHYRDIRAAVDEVRHALHGDAPPDPAEIRRIVARLIEVERRVRL